MLTFSDEQLDAIEETMEARFLAQLHAQIDVQFADATGRLRQLPDGEQRIARLREYAKQLVERAEEQDMESDGDVATYVALMLGLRLLDRDAAERVVEWLTPILESEDTPGIVRMAMVERHLETLAPRDPVAARLRKVVFAMREQFGGRV
jgi:hypothetical protein